MMLTEYFGKETLTTKEQYALNALWQWRNGDEDSFDSEFFNIMSNSDEETLDKFALGFPEEVFAFRCLVANEYREREFLSKLKSQFEKFIEG